MLYKNIDSTKKHSVEQSGAGYSLYVTSVIIKNTPKKIQTQITKKTTLRGQNQQQKGHTTYIGGFAVLFFDGMSKERKIQKDKVQSVK